MRRRALCYVNTRVRLEGQTSLLVEALLKLQRNTVNNSRRCEEVVSALARSPFIVQGALSGADSSEGDASVYK